MNRRKACQKEKEAITTRHAGKKKSRNLGRNKGKRTGHAGRKEGLQEGKEGTPNKFRSR
jgi:hypothetical protein